MNNKQKYWFKRRRYGYGWTPSTQEGWIVTAIFILSLLITARLLLKNENAIYILIAIIIVNVSLIVLYKKGPKPKWRWGKKPGDDPKLDY